MTGFAFVGLPIDFTGGVPAAVWASAKFGADNTAANAKTAEATRFVLMVVFQFQMKDTPIV